MERRIYLKIWLAIILGMAAALAAVRAFTAANDAGAESLLGRVLQAQRALPQIIAEEKDLVMFFGSSMVQAGFSPREFDMGLAERGVGVKSFNFGFGGLNPLFQDYVSRRIVDEFLARDRRLKLVMIEFNPFQATQTRREGARALEEAYIALLASPEELREITLEDPERGLRMAQIRYLRDGISAEMVTTFFWAEPFQAPRGNDLDMEEDPEVEEELEALLPILNERFEAEYPDFDGSDWYYPWQGGGTIKSERPPETIALFDDYYRLTQTDYQKTLRLQNRIETSDILELRFDPELIEAFIRIVENFKQIADHVEIVMLPKNAKWIKNPPEALARQAAVIKQIEEATGLPVRDFQHVDGITDEMFSDTTHLNRYYGAVAFTEFLVEEYAPLLR